SPLAMHLGDSPRSRRNGDCPPYDARRTVAITMAPVHLPSEACLESLPAGTTLGRYEIVAPLGAGGMGVVYRARDLRLDREVAVKLLPNHLSKEQDAMSRFQREAKALAALSHAGILSIYDFDSDQGYSFTVMELLKG